jgi:hypothetical protein
MVSERSSPNLQSRAHAKVFPLPGPASRAICSPAHAHVFPHTVRQVKEHLRCSVPLSPFLSPSSCLESSAEKNQHARHRSTTVKERFPDVAHVRLRSRMHHKYLHADEDGTSVFLRPVPTSLNAAWRVHWVVRNDVPFVLVHVAAYGRYLATMVNASSMVCTTTRRRTPPRR